MTLATKLNYPLGVARDGLGNIFFADWLGAQLYELPRATPPTLSFAKTARGSVSTDSPQTVTVANIGNQELDFSALSYPGDFPEHGSQLEVSPEYGPVSNGCIPDTALSAGAVCTLSIEFNPWAALPSSSPAALSESATLTTNTLNVAGTAQKVNLTGTETTGVKTDSAVALTASTTTPVPGTAITLTATVTSTDGTPTGTVSFYAGQALIGKAVALAKGVASTSATLSASGTVTASYSGDQNFNASNSNSITVTLTKATPAVTLTSSAATATVGLNVTFTASVSTVIKGTAPTGTVQFLNGSTVLGSGNVNGSTGKATYATSALPVGANTITAIYSGDSKYQQASAPNLTETINLAVAAVTLTSAKNPAAAGAQVTFTAAVASAIAGVAPTGTVQFLDGNTVMGSSTLSTGKATYSTSALAVGANTISARYSGDGKYAAATSKGLVETVNKATPTATLTASPNPATVGAQVVFTVTVSTVIAGVAPTGSVQFKVGTASGGSATLSGGVATWSTTSLKVGSNTVTATYGGDNNYATVASKSLTETINKATPTLTLDVSPNPGSPTGSIALTATVSTAISGVVPTGSVKFYNGAIVAGTGTLSGGIATATLKNHKVGTYPLKTVYAGDGNYATATSNTVSEVINNK